MQPFYPLRKKYGCLAAIPPAAISAAIFELFSLVMVYLSSAGNQLDFMNPLSPVTGPSATRNNHLTDLTYPAFWNGLRVTFTNTLLRWRVIPHGQDPQCTSKAIWSRSNCSHNILLEEDPRWLLRQPTAGVTDLAISEQEYTHGLHIIEITWSEKQRGSNAVLGLILEKDAEKQSPGYVNLIGSDEKSCGWDLIKNQMLYGGNVLGDYPNPKDGVPTDFNKAPEKILCVLNMYEGVLGFEVNGHYLGDAFSGLAGKKVHIAASLVWGHAKVGIQYQSRDIEPCTLQFFCIQTIRKQLQNLDDIKLLPLPETLKQWLRD